MMFLKTQNLDREKILIKIGRRDDVTRRNDKKLSVFRMTGHFPTLSMTSMVIYIYI